MQIDRNSPIGIFDSGGGGLTVARQVMKEMPDERIVYFGDTARAPYGVLPRETITAYSTQIMRFMAAMRMKMVIIACNTICVSSYYELRAAFNVPIFEVVSPAAADCVAGVPREGCRVGVIATPATVRSGGYRIELLKLHPYLAIFQQPCPNLVILAEKGRADSAAAALMCEMYLRPLREENLDALILGCTHFPLFTRAITEYLGPSLRIVDPAVASAAKVRSALRESYLLAERVGEPEHEFYISGDVDTFKGISRNLLGINIDVEQVDITKY